MWIIVILIISVGAVVLIEYRILWHLFKCSSAAHNNCSATDYIISETISITFLFIVRIWIILNCFGYHVDVKYNSTEIVL